MPALSPYLLLIVLLVGSNVFMTAAWYWHLRYKEVPRFSVILFSWAWPSSSSDGAILPAQYAGCGRCCCR
jgi:putative drug/metabolite transporter DUF486